MGSVPGLVNAADLFSQLRGVEKISEEISSKTIKDMKSRAPGWISKAVREKYGISASDFKGEADERISSKGAGGVKVSGNAVENLAIEYKGRLLTPTHFKMKPASPTGGSGGKRALVKATIKKGQQKVLGGRVFVGTGVGGRALPFQRKGKERLPIEGIKTLSIPQMIQYSDGEENPLAGPGIHTALKEGLQKRLDNHIKQGQKKVGKVRG